MTNRLIPIKSITGESFSFKLVHGKLKKKKINQLLYSVKKGTDLRIVRNHHSELQVAKQAKQHKHFQKSDTGSFGNLFFWQNIGKHSWGMLYFEKGKGNRVHLF